MQVFEFHFNPKLKPDLIFDSFCYQPENIYEKRVGSLYMVGLLKNVLPQNLHFLERLAKVIKDQYYRSTLISPEKSLKESLKKANEFLEGIAKKGDVSWLGNLSFGVISLKNFELNFTKVGDLKFFLLRGGQVIDVDQKLKFKEIEPYPLTIFGNIVSGKLTENDIVLVLTKEVLEVFQSQNLIEEMAKMSLLEEKKLRAVFNNKKVEFSKISGVCLLISLTKEVIPLKRETIIAKQRKFSIREVFQPIITRAKSILSDQTYFKKNKKPHLGLPKVIIPKVTLPKFKLTKNQIIILALIFFLTLGFLISQREEKERLEIYQTTLKEIQGKVSQAESFLILKTPQAESQANFLLKESWEKISSILKESDRLPQDFQNQILSLKDKIGENLYQLNKLKIIEKPELLFEFDLEQFVPQKMLIFDNELYFFNPYSQNLFKIDKNGKGQLIPVEKKFNLATSLVDSILFLSKPNQHPALVILKEGQFSEAISLTTPHSDFNFNDLSSYHSHLYFLDKKSGEIIKYPYLEGLKWGEPQLWLRNKKATAAKSMTVDDSIWILNRDNSISRYYGGWLKETFTLEIFPSPKDFSKIFTFPHLPYLYILEPSQKRIIIISKTGQMINQFQSQKFDNLLDFAVSNDGKIIWLLSGLRVYKIEIPI